MTRADNGVQLTLQSTDTDANAGPNLKLERAVTGADSDLLGTIIFLGRDDAGNGEDYARIFAQIADASNGTEDGILEFRTILAGTEVRRIDLGATETVFNEDSKDLDFRVESDGNTHMLYVDAGNNAVGIGVSDPGGLPLHLKVASGDNKLRMETANKDAFVMELEDSSGNLKLGTNTTAGALEIVDAGGVIISVADNSDTLTLKSTDADASAGPFLNLNRNSASPADNDYIGEIKFDGRNDAAQAVTYAGFAGRILDASDGTEDGRFELYTKVAGAQISRFLATDETVINEDSVDLNFRVESNNQAFMFFVDAGEDAVGVGRQPGVKMDIQGSSTGTLTGLRIRNAGQVAGSEIQQVFSLNRDGSDVDFECAGIRVGKEQNWTTTASTVDGFMAFRTIQNETAAEKMRLNASGNLLLNGTADIDVSHFAILQDNAKNAITIKSQKTTASMGLQLQNSSGTRVGFIQYDASSTTFSTTSDYRLKENITDLTSATDRLKQLSPKRFNFIANADTTVDGFLAHEVQAVVPEAVTGTKDAVDADGNPDYQGIDQSKLVPLLVATIKELEARIAALESE